MQPHHWLILEWDGATPALLQRLAAAGVMPTWARLRESSSFWRLPWSGLGSPTAAWTTLRTGCGPERHGVWDESRLDARRGWVVPQEESTLRCPALPELLPGGSGGVVLDDHREAFRIWKQKPTRLEELSASVHRTAELLTSLETRAQQAAAQDWHVLEIRVQVLALLQHRLWPLLEGEAQGCPWSAAAQEAFRALDRSLEQFWQLAERCGATLVVTSPYGFVPFREKITLVELLRQQGLLALASGSSKLAYRTRRWLWRAFRRLAPGPAATSPGVRGPVGSLLPLDWHRSRVVSLHGQHAALVYLNTPERFGTRVLTTASARDDALAETLRALREARHPVTREPLFVEVVATSTENPDQPDVVARPASGLLTRHKPDHRRQLLRSDPSLTAVQGSDGLLLVHGLGHHPSAGDALSLVAVANTLGDMHRLH